MDDEDMHFEGIVTDSEDEYSENEKRLLKKVRKARQTENFDSEDEVLGFKSEEEYEEERDSLESDIEGLQDEDDDIPNDKAWGKKNKNYYSTDYVDPDYSSLDTKKQAIAEMEEEEARKIQKRLAEQLDDADFGLDMIETKDDEDTKEEEVFIKTDLSKLSKRQKQQLLEKENPEFFALVKDFKDRLLEINDVLQPFLHLVDRGKCPDCLAVFFVKTKYQLLLNYCVNLSFYLMLKAKRLPVKSHPVLKRLTQYKQLLNQLELGQENLMKEIIEILEAEKNGLPLYNVSDNSLIPEQKKKKIESNKKQKKTKPLTKDISDIENDEEIPKKVEEMEEFTEEEKRAITYEMAKNKGLTPYRKKELRNPRVKHRNKYRKAKIRRKGAVREVRKELTRYSGEISGIKASVKKSIKLK